MSNKKPLLADAVSFKLDEDGYAFTIKTCGFGRPIMRGWLLSGSNHSAIHDGISLDLWDSEDVPKGRDHWSPGGLISFVDLEQIYLAAKALREQRAREEKEKAEHVALLKQKALRKKL